MIEQLLAEQNLPFAVALALMLALAVLQLAGLGHHLGAHADVDVGAELDVDAGLISLLGLGRLPLMMWLMLLLALFGLVGLAGQQLASALTGAPLDGWLAALLAGVAALPITGLVARPLGAILPRDETTAVSVDTLVGREGELVIGTASVGSPARVRVVDVHGQAHHVMVEPDDAAQRFMQGDRVLLVRREGHLFKAIARGDRYLPRLD